MAQTYVSANLSWISVQVFVLTSAKVFSFFVFLFSLKLYLYLLLLKPFVVKSNIGRPNCYVAYLSLIGRKFPSHPYVFLDSTVLHRDCTTIRQFPAHQFLKLGKGKVIFIVIFIFLIFNNCFKTAHIHPDSKACGDQLQLDAASVAILLKSFQPKGFYFIFLL